MFEHGYFKDSDISNYRDYTAKKYGDLCDSLVSLGMKQKHRIVDFGCATGALVYEFKKRGFKNVVGTDVSWWAIKHGRQQYGLLPNELQPLNYYLLEAGCDWLLCLDVLEHICDEELGYVLPIMKFGTLVARIPVCANEGEVFVLPVSRNDKTHIQCHTKSWWRERIGHKFCGYIWKSAIYDSDGVFCGLWRQ